MPIVIDVRPLKSAAGIELPTKRQTKLTYTFRAHTTMTHIHRIEVTNASQTIDIAVAAGTGITVYPNVPIERLWPAMIDMFAIYPDLTGFDLADFMPKELVYNRFLDTMHTLKFTVDFKECRIGIVNGDSGETHWAIGRSFLHATAEVLTANGYKPDPEHPGSTMLQWIQDFEYGFKRASDEQLALELEAITTPNKGSW